MKRSSNLEGYLWAPGRPLHVESVVDERGRVRSPPIGGDKTLKPDLVAQNSKQNVRIASCINAIHLVVRTHDGRDAGIYRVDEVSYVDLVKRLIVDHDVAGICVIGHKVFGLRHDALALHA